MATKPSSILGYNPSRSNCVTVPSGKMAVGFLPGEKPPAQYLGDILERVDRWLEYIKDGAWTGNTTITGTFGVTGNASITGTLGVAGATTITGDFSVTGNTTMATLNGPLIYASLTDPISPTTNNNYNPTGLSAAIILKLATAGTTTITGLAGGVQGRIIKIINRGAHSVTLTNEDAASSAANRFTLPGAASLVLLASSTLAVELVYDSARWVVISKNF